MGTVTSTFFARCTRSKLSTWSAPAAEQRGRSSIQALLIAAAARADALTRDLLPLFRDTSAIPLLHSSVFSSLLPRLSRAFWQAFQRRRVQRALTAGKNPASVVGPTHRHVGAHRQATRSSLIYVYTGFENLYGLQALNKSPRSSSLFREELVTIGFRRTSHLIGARLAPPLSHAV